MLIVSPMSFRSKQSIQASSMSTPFVVSVSEMMEPVRWVMARHSHAQQIVILHAPQHWFAPMQQEGKHREFLRDDVLFDAR